MPDNVILRVRTGSHAYGTNTPESDEDESLVWVENPRDVLGVRAETKIKHRKNDDEDRQEYPLRRFVYLATKGNPSVLEILWAPVLDITPEGNHLRLHRGLFVARHIVTPYRGFIKSQTMRLMGLKGQLRVTREELRSRDGYDTKYAMHCTRLAFQCEELLTTGNLTLPMGNKAMLAYLMRIRAGEVPFNYWFNHMLEMDRVLDTLQHDESIPAQPPIPAIEFMTVNLHLRSWLDYDPQFTSFVDTNTKL